MSRQHPRTESPRCSKTRRRPTNRCQRMQSSGAVDRFRHFRFKNPPISEVRGDFWVMGRSRAYFCGKCKYPRTKSPRCSEPRRLPTNCCRRMLSPGAVDRFRHFRFKNPPIVEVGGDFWVMGRSWAYFGGNVNTLERNPLAAVNLGVSQRSAVDVCYRQAL